MFVNNYAQQCIFGSKTWFDIGKLIYLISGGGNDGYRLWLVYSKYSPDFNEDQCYNMWSDFDELMPDDFSEDDYAYSLL